MGMAVRFVVVVLLTCCMVVATVLWERHCRAPASRPPVIAAHGSPKDAPPPDEEPWETLSPRSLRDRGQDENDSPVELGSIQGGELLDLACRFAETGGSSSWPSEPPIGLGSGDAVDDVASTRVARVSPNRPDTLAGSGPLLEPAKIQNLTAVQPLPKAIPTDPLKGVETLDVMRRLAGEDSQAAAQARTELLRRGFSEVDLELARQLVSPDREVRKHLARSVPRLQSVDAVPWLWTLATDEDADVRMTAITMLATTGDPALLDRVEARARQDADPRIQELGDQIARQRVLAASRGETPGQSRGSFLR
jgi:hypothetical protein